MVTALQSKEDVENFAPFMTDHDMGAFMEVLLPGEAAKERALKNTREMQEIVGRIRLQLRHIVRAARRCEERMQAAHSAVERRYLRYESAMCAADLRRHWAFYRFAMREYMRV